MNLKRLIPLMTASVLAALPLRGLADDEPQDAHPAGAEVATPSASATVNLLRLMVRRGLITHEEASGLIWQAEREAALARAQAEAVQAAAAEIRAAAAQEIQLHEEDIRVAYVPRHVRDEIAQDVRHELLSEARAGNLQFGPTSPLPGWIGRLNPKGDLRLRVDFASFPSGNENTGSFPNFHAINSGAPFDVTGSAFSPQWNVDRDRVQPRLRARFGLESSLADGFFLGGRLATGSGSSPVSTNQTLGSPGNFSRYEIWLDRAYLRWESSQGLWQWKVTGGRADSPFFSTDLIWDSDLGFDGLAIEAKADLSDEWSWFTALGAFPIFNTAFAFPSNQPSKHQSQDRYLFGAQMGVEWIPSKDTMLKLAAAYYHFDRIEGRLSDPFVPLSSADAGSTDLRRPSFAQKGNTYMALRDILPVAANDYGQQMQWQYFGLASSFRVASLSARADFFRLSPLAFSVYGEVVNNLAYDSGRVSSRAVNNRGPEIVLPPTADSPAQVLPGRHAGGALGWIGGFDFGRPTLEKRWDWKTSLSYRYLESDAMVDAFTDSDFGLGGTNLKGFSLSASLAFNRYVSLTLRWMSASEVAGPSFRSDILQFDINSRF